MNVIFVVGIAFMALVCARVLQNFGASAGAVVSTVAIVLLLFVVLPVVGEILAAVRGLGLRAGLEDESLSTIFRGLGIALVTKFAAGICQDSGQKSLSETVEYCGQIALVALAVPMIMELAQRIGSMNL